MTTPKRRPRLPVCSTCNARHREPTEYQACARTHAAARAIIIRQIESARAGTIDPSNLPSDVRFYLDKMAAREEERASLRARGTITPDTLPAITGEQWDSLYGPVAPDDEFMAAGRSSMLAQDRWCWFEGRPWSRTDKRLKMRLLEMEKEKGKGKVAA